MLWIMKVFRVQIGQKLRGFWSQAGASSLVKFGREILSLEKAPHQPCQSGSERIWWWLALSKPKIASPCRYRTSYQPPHHFAFVYKKRPDLCSPSHLLPRLDLDARWRRHLEGEGKIVETEATGRAISHNNPPHPMTMVSQVSSHCR
jgi:hypothetical protein